MISKHARYLVLGLALSFGIASCADSTTAPKPVAPSNGLIGGLLGTVTGLLDIIGQPVDKSVYVLRRTTPLAQPITVTKSIGYNGGTISVPEAGFTMTIPRGAVTSTTNITVTALAGDRVQYDFGPHGFVFQAPVKVNQSLDGTYAVNKNVSYEAVYYGPSSNTNLLTKLVDLVLEVLKVVVDPLTNSASFDVRHFSGSLVSSGRMDAGGY